MKREIKFRAWDNVHNRFIQSFKNDYVEYGNLWMDLNGEIIESGTFDRNFSKQFSLCQYTGLKDKNGKEIYEGDIVATSNSNPEFDLWDKEDYGFQEVTITPEMGVWMGCFSWDDEDSVYSLQFLEVVGNIYENPELLKKDSK